MNYGDGQEIKVGDVVGLGEDRNGKVVASIDAGEFSAVCTREEWSFLERGVLIDFPRWGIVHYEEPEDDLELVARA